MSPQPTDPLNPNSKISWNVAGEKVISTPQPDGSTLVVTMGGGSDGKERPYTKTEVIPPAGTGRAAPPPVVDYTNKPITTGQWTNDNGTTTKSVLTRSGTELQTSGGGSEGIDKPWTVTQAVDRTTHGLTTTVESGGKTWTDDGFGTRTLTETLGDGVHRVTTQHGGLDGAEKPWQDVVVTDGKGNITRTRIAGGVTDSTITDKVGNLVQKTHINWDGTTSTTTYVGNRPLDTVTTTKNANGEPIVITTDSSGVVTNSYVVPPPTPSVYDPLFDGLKDGIKHDGKVLGDLFNNLVWAPIEHNLVPHPFGRDPNDTTTSPTDWQIPFVPPESELRPWPTPSDLAWTALDIASLFAGPEMLGLDTAALLERVGVTMAGRTAYRDAIATGATAEEAAAARQTAVQDYIISHQAGDAVYSQARAAGESTETAEALRQRAINEALARQQALRNGLNAAEQQGQGLLPQGYRGPHPGVSANTGRFGVGDLPSGTTDPHTYDSQLAPNSPGAQPNTLGLNPTPLSPLLQALKDDLGIDGQAAVDGFVADHMAQLDAELEGIQGRVPALTGVVNSIRDGIRNVQDSLGLGGDARVSGGASRGGDLGASPNGGRGRGPGGRGPTDPPPPRTRGGGLGEGDGDGVPNGYRVDENGNWSVMDPDGNWHDLPNGTKPVIMPKGNIQWHGPNGYGDMPAWAKVPSDISKFGNPVDPQPFEGVLPDETARKLHSVDAAQDANKKIRDKAQSELKNLIGDANKPMKIRNEDGTLRSVTIDDLSRTKLPGTLEELDRAGFSDDDQKLLESLAQQLSASKGIVSKLSELRGEIGGDFIAKHENIDIIHEGSGPGTADRIGVKTLSDGSRQVVDLELKGGDGMSARTVTIDGKQIKVQQGTPEYLRDEFKEGSAARAKLEKYDQEHGTHVLQDLLEGRAAIDYRLVRTDPGGKITVSRFDPGPDDSFSLKPPESGGPQAHPAAGPIAADLPVGGIGTPEPAHPSLIDLIRGTLNSVAAIPVWTHPFPTPTTPRTPTPEPEVNQQLVMRIAVPRQRGLSAAERENRVAAGYVARFR
ncbi:MULTISPECIES: hypothetical protein [unclassified Nocardia]|uniref:hypothetical protein n=1 Tax=unclassified Nocardia TaxID=2637762 RepID=UPI001CE49A07|nr:MULTISPECIES: hypothetical protein [unclassified Nocardia]